MVNELGEIAVSVKEEGTEDALDEVADSTAESEGGRTAGNEGGGGVGGILGGISKKLVAILGLVAFLASLKPIQELLSGIQRLFSTAILPLVMMLMTFLRPLMQDLLRFIADLDFDNLMEDLTRKLIPILDGLPSRLVSGLTEAVSKIISNIGSIIGRSTAEKANIPIISDKENVSEEDIINIDERARKAQSQLFRNIVVSVTGFGEQSQSSMDQNASETTNSETLNSGPGG